MIDEEVSLGDYVIAGGEAAALVIVEGVVRLIPDVVGNVESIERESFREGTIEEPHYTRPAVFRGWEVPEVLRSGDHGRIAEWRRQQALLRTRFVGADDPVAGPAWAPAPVSATLAEWRRKQRDQRTADRRPDLEADR